MKVKYAFLLSGIIFISCLLPQEQKEKANKDQRDSITILPAIQDSLGEIFTVVEEMPRFPGCEHRPVLERKTCADQKMLQYLYKNIRYPAISKEEEIRSTFVIQFIIEKDGQVSHPKVKRSISQEFDEGIIDLVKSMPTFIPGKHKGEAVRVYFNLPVRIRLE